MDSLRALARSVRPSVERLDALLVPLSTTFKDSEGRFVLPESDARSELVRRLREAHDEIGAALEILEP
jgi:hypothetical protein